LLEAARERVGEALLPSAHVCELGEQLDGAPVAEQKRREAAFAGFVAREGLDQLEQRRVDSRRLARAQTLDREHAHLGVLVAEETEQRRVGARVAHAR
jgi:hypothetical protein